MVVKERSKVWNFPKAYRLCDAFLILQASLVMSLWSGRLILWICR